MVTPRPNHFTLIAVERASPSTKESDPARARRIYYLFPARLRLYHLLLVVGFLTAAALEMALTGGAGDGRTVAGLTDAWEFAGLTAACVIVLMVGVPGFVYYALFPPVLTRHLGELPPEHRQLWEPGIAHRTIGRTRRWRAWAACAADLAGVDYLIAGALALLEALRRLLVAILHRIWAIRLRLARPFLRADTPEVRREIRSSRDAIERTSLRWLHRLRPHWLRASLDHWNRSQTGRSLVLVSIALRELILRDADNPLHSYSLRAVRWFVFTQTPLWVGWLGLIFLLFATTLGEFALTLAAIWWVVVSILFLHPERPMIEQKLGATQLSRLPNPRPVSNLFPQDSGQLSPVFPNEFYKQVEYILLTVFFVAALALIGLERYPSADAARTATAPGLVLLVDAPGAIGACMAAAVDLIGSGLAQIWTWARTLSDAGGRFMGATDGGWWDDYGPAALAALIGAFAAGLILRRPAGQRALRRLWRTVWTMRVMKPVLLLIGGATLLLWVRTG